MTSRQTSRTNPDQPMIYRIRIQGHLEGDWTDWFAGLTISREDNGNTILTGPVVDQAALFGLLRRVRDLGMPLLSVTSIAPRRTDGADCIE